MRGLGLSFAAVMFWAALSGASLADPRSTAIAAFEAPDGWTTDVAPGRVRTVSPEGDVRLVVIDIGAASNAADAVLKAWAAVDPSFARKVRFSTQRAAREGWDETWHTEYEVSPDEKLFLVANAYRRDKAWTVLVASGPEATVDKRSGQIRVMIDTFRPLGVAAEDFAGKTARPFDAKARAAIKAFWTDAMAAYAIPGMAYAFIDRNGVVEEGGMGVRTLGQAAPIDAHTRFMIASNTKGMTTLLMARLVDAGKLNWDERVVEADPTFKIGDPAVLNVMKIRHLICACTGMPRQDLEWIMTGGVDTPADEAFKLLAPMKPTTKFGEAFQYSNLLASAAGYVAGHVAYPGVETGAAYDKAMRTYVFEPLGMKDTTFSKAVAVGGDHADPHGFDADGKMAVGTVDKSDSIYFARPAGGAWSSAHDLALYALNELREGVLPGGGRLVSADALLARRNQGMVTGEATYYGMGLETSSRWGVKIVHHGGAMPGYKTDWIILPDAGVGLVMLFNSEEAWPILDATRRRLVELLYDARPEASATVTTGASAYRANLAKERSLTAIPPDPAVVAQLASRYESPELGFIDVKRQADGGVIFDFGSFSSRMGTRKNEDGSTNLVMLDPTITGWSLSTRPGDKFTALVMQDAQHEYVYTPKR
ncbi:serine hydrolase [uncultured Caulobacter sp.]|uniref:serine hydrolase domain-containing protein n=1 Tax=uncultured Caulobacter sp. TaxID=158749 RepID=UPI00261453B5|nr:serine hydrolase domain-containing protein [uncultured Caulobacter sp.]